jgi:hypothetical protein
MSGPDETDRSFLARWSQRKQEAKQPEPKPDAPADETAAASGSTAPQVQEEPPEFDLSTLPTLEELTGSTDITAFLHKGVPEQLRNAALRKSWALDPAIRNYVNPALEYAYDWNAPGGVPGGGELGAAVDVARLVSQIIGEPAGEMINSNSNSTDEAALSPQKPSEFNPSTAPRADLPEQSLQRSNESTAAETEVVSKANDDVGQPAPLEESSPARPAAPQHPLRRHGTAKPTV